MAGSSCHTARFSVSLDAREWPWGTRPTPLGPHLTADEDASRDACAILEAVVRHDTPSVRPDDILAGFRELCGLRIEQTLLAIRLNQGPLDEETGTVGDPLALDRDAPSQVLTAAGRTVLPVTGQGRRPLTDL